MNVTAIEDDDPYPFEDFAPTLSQCFVILGVGVSIVITAVMCVLVQSSDVQSVLVVGRPTSNFHFSQLIVTTVLLSVSLTVVSVCAVHEWKRTKRKAATDVHCYDNTVFTLQEQEVEDLRVCKKTGASPSQLAESEEARFYYAEVVRDGESGLSSGQREWNDRLRNLLVLQAAVWSVRLVANLYKLGRSKALEMMIPMEFLQSVLFIGQGIFLLFLFGVDVRTVTISARKWCRKVRPGADQVPPPSGEKGEASQLCNQFRRFYFARCFRDLARERRNFSS